MGVFLHRNQPRQTRYFGFTAIDPVSGERRLVNSKIIGARKIWQILNEKGLSTGLVNLPITYPPEEVDGYMVSGMMTPDNADNYTYPVSIAAELAGLEVPYVVDVPVAAKEAETLAAVKRLRESLRGRHAACLHLMDKHPCDFLMTVLIVPDRLQHIYWKYLDKDTGLYDTEKGKTFRKEIMGLYREMDEVLGDIFSKLSDDCQVFIMSDHGFCNLQRYFYFNEWLSRNGYFNTGSKTWMVTAYQKLRVGKMLERFIWFRRAQKMRQEGVRRLVDWENTSAYTREQGLFVNLVGREEKGSVPPERYEAVCSEIAEKLKAFTDPDTGERVVGSISFKNELYHGPYMEMAADFIPVLDDYRTFIHDAVMRDKLFDSIDESPEGIHHPDGVFAAFGPNIRGGLELEGANIVDVTPTILYALGLPVPDHMDGRVMEELFEPDYMNRNPVKKESGDDEMHDERGSVYSEEEEKEIQKQLRGMGYM